MAKTTAKSNGAASKDDTDLTTTVKIGVPPAPGGGPTVLTSGPPAEYDLKGRATTEYVAGGYFAPLGDYVRTLPAWIDPTQRDFGLDIYQRMMESDPQVASCIEIYKAAVLADGWRISPAKDSVEEPDEASLKAGGKPKRTSSDEAKEAADFCRDCLLGMTATPFDLFLRMMLDAIFQGNKVAEIVMKVERNGRWAGDLVLDRLKPKPHRSTAFVMDAYDNLVGLLGILPNVPFYGMWPAFGFLAGDGLTLLPGYGRSTLQKDAPSLLPRTKFCVLTFDGQDGNPQGRSVLRRVFTPFWWKENGYAIWGKFIAKHADPTVIGEAAPDSIGNVPAFNPDGSPMIDGFGNPVMLTSVQAMGENLATLQNGSYMAIPNGADVRALDVKNNGEAISLFFDMCDHQIAKGILGQTLATEEGKHASRAQAGVHEHAKDDVTRYGQVILSRMVTNDLLRLLVLEKYGPDAVHLIPDFNLGQEETMSFAEFATGAAGVGYTVHTSQFPGMDEMGGLPPRDIAAWQSDIAEQKNRAQAATSSGSSNQDDDGWN